MTANTMKIDVRILNFPWLRSDTNLALMSTVKSELKVEMTYNEQAQIPVEYDRNGNVEKPSKWTDSVFISFDDATTDVGFVPFGDYSWDDEAVATQTNASTTMADLMSAYCQAALLELYQQQYARSSDVINTTLPPGCEDATLAPESLYIAEEKEDIRVVATSPPAFLYGYENHQHIAYSFVGPGAQGAKEIYWDPEAGISYEEAQSSAVSTTSMTVSSTAFLRSILMNAFVLVSGICYLVI